MFSLISNIAGMAIAPTGVALLTDFVLGDSLAIRAAVILIVVPVSLVGTETVVFAAAPFRRTVAAADWKALPGTAGPRRSAW